MSFHTPVLEKEVINLLVRQAGVYIDGTMGGAGHSIKIIEKWKQESWLRESRLYGFDKDQEAIDYAMKRLHEYKEQVQIFHCGFEKIEETLGNVQACGILVDLGISSFQIDMDYRGFSFQKEAELDMRMSREGLSAKDIINTYDEAELQHVFYRYGEEPKSKFIARAILQYRKNKNIDTTLELGALIERFYLRKVDITKAKARIFQAVRIEVNQELEALKIFLRDSVKRLSPKGRLAVISYHSLEDRIVKQFFAELVSEDWGPKGVALREPIFKREFELITKKPITPCEEELEKNPRSRSAKLRVIEKL